MSADEVDYILEEVAVERLKQDRKWGEQNWPMVNILLGGDKQRGFHHECSEEWKLKNDRRAKAKGIAWDGILLEEVHEAFAESDIEKVREEMIQVAAVAVAIIECIDRKLSG